MRIWLAAVGEPLPSDGPKARLFRTGLLARMLVERGHDVVYWASTFDHIRKLHRFSADVQVDVAQRYKLVLLHSGGYRRNVSIRRVVDYQVMAFKFMRLARGMPQPDVVLCSLPTLELAAAVVRYARRNNVPVVVDVRDLWPDIFLEVFPQWSRSAARFMLAPMFGLARYACSRATAIVGMCPAFVDWGVGLAARARTDMDRCFPLAYTSQPPREQELRDAEKFWQQHGVRGREHEFTACFFGTMERQVEIDTVIEAARRLRDSGRTFRFVLCGTGRMEPQYRKQAEVCDNVVMPGWVGAPEIWTLMRLSTVGLAPYRSSDSYVVSLPNKPIEYLSAGLPIVSSLKGALEQLLAAEGCGVTYSNGNPGALASTLIGLHDTSDRLRAFSRNALRVYHERFVAEKVYGDMSEHLEAIGSRTVPLREGRCDLPRAEGTTGRFEST